MGLQTLAGFRDRLQTMLGNRGFDDADLNYWVNQGVQELCARVQFDRLKTSEDATIAQGARVFTFDSFTGEVDGILEIRNLTDEILVGHIDDSRYQQLDETAEGDPQYWTRIGGEITFWPLAEVETSLRIILQQVHPQLSGDTDTTELSSKWDRVVQLLSKYHALMDLEEEERAVVSSQFADKLIQQWLENESIEGESTPVPVRPIESFAEFRGVLTYEDESL